MKIGKYVDETVSTWQEQRPDLDFAPMGYMLRFHAMAEAAMDKIQIITKSHGLTIGEFDVLATLRRHGASSTLTPSFIAEVAMVSPSGLTHRLSQLERSGHIVRISDDSDRRSSLVSITKSGAAVADQIIAQIAEHSARMYDAIPAKDLEQFNQVVALISTQLESDVLTSK
jgi:DNA-binding MarR family transcriptional regulator